MIKSFLTTLILSIPFSLLAQTNEGDLRMEKSFWGVKFYEGSRLLKPRDVLNVMEVNPEAYNTFKKAKSNYDAAQVLSAIGGFMIGWPIGTAIGGGDPQWGVAAGGLGLVLVSIPFNAAFVKHSKSAIEIYNSGPDPASARQYSKEVIPYGTGVKFVLKF